LQTIKELAEEGMTCILVTHEMAFACEMADHIYFTDHGVIVEHGPPETVLPCDRDASTIHEICIKSRDMNSRTRRIFFFELGGAAFMVAVGSAMHFLFDLAEGWRPLALIAAVNESIWEHLKLAFWPGLFWAGLAPLPAGLRRRDVLAAKGPGLLVTTVLIVAVFTTYVTILGHNILALDIGTFVIAIMIGQALSVVLLTGGAFQRRAFIRAGLGLLGLQIIAYSLFTYLPPDHWLFIEASSGLRGIPEP